MLFNNRGYVGQSRSVRSQEAIEEHEVPLNQITRDLINEVIEELVDEETIDKEQENWLKAIPVYVWKAQCPTSWHHTGKYYHETYHYDLPLYAEEFIDNPEIVDESVKDHKRELSERRQALLNESTEPEYEVYYYSKDIWGGTRRHPKIVDIEHGYGVAKKESSRLYPVSVSDEDWPNNSYYSIDGNYITVKQYSGYLELVAEHTEFKGTKRELNKVLKTLGVTPLTLKQEFSKVGGKD